MIHQRRQGVNLMWRQKGWRGEILNVKLHRQDVLSFNRVNIFADVKTKLTEFKEVSNMHSVKE